MLEMVRATYMNGKAWVWSVTYLSRNRSVMAYWRLGFGQVGSKTDLETKVTNSFIGLKGVLTAIVRLKEIVNNLGILKECLRLDLVRPTECRACLGK